MGKSPETVAVDEAANRAFVPNYGAATVTMLDATTGKALRTMPAAIGPIAASADQVLNRVVVVSRGSVDTDRQLIGAGMVTVLDGRTGNRLATIPVGTYATAVQVDETIHRAFVANEGSDSVSIIDLARNTLVRTVTVGRQPSAIGIDQRVGHVLVTNYGSDTVSMLASAGGTVLHTARVGSGPWTVEVDTRHHAYVSETGANTVTILDTTQGTVLGAATVGEAPSEIGVDDRTGQVLVVNTRSNTISSMKGSAIPPAPRR